MKLGLFLLFCLSASATTVYLPAVGAGSCQVTAASNATPSKITCNAHGFSSGQVIAIINEASSQSAGFGVMGLRKVATVVDSNNFTITDINGTNIAGPATFTCPNAGTIEALVHPLNCRAIPLTAYTAQSHPRTYGLDGPAGTLALSLQDTSSTGKANTNDPLYGALQTITSNWSNSAVPFSSDQGDFSANAALQYWATGDATAKTKALNGLSNAAFNLTRGSTACDETQQYCYYRFGATEYVSAWDHALYGLAYSIMRGQMTSGQRQAFADQVLNDLSHAHNGLALNGSDTDCTKIALTLQSGTVTTTGTAVVGSGTSFTSLAVGGVFITAIATGDNEAVITSITDNTHMTLSLAPGGGNVSGQGFYYGRPWATGDCGAVWIVKHHPGAPFADDTDYPNPGQSHYARGENNLTVTKLMGWINLALALADDDPRAVELLAIASAYYYDSVLPAVKQEWTGSMFTTTYYSNGRWRLFTGIINVALKNGVVGGPDYFSTSIAWKRAMVTTYLNYIPGTFNANGGVWGESDQFNFDNSVTQWLALYQYMYPTSPEAAYMTYWARNSSTLNYWRSTFFTNNAQSAPPSWIFGDPNATQTSPASAPTQYVLMDNDSSQCAAYGWTYCNTTRGARVWFSRTDNLASSATAMMVNAHDYYTGDHAFTAQSGTTQIMKNGVYLFGANHPTNVCSQECSNGGADSTTMQFGVQSNWVDDTGSPATYAASQILRWAGTDPTGDSGSRYSYGLIDLSGQYLASANVTLAYRHVAHFKKAGFQDYIVVYDAMSTSSGLSKTAFLHFSLNGSGYPGGVSRSGATITSNQSSAGMKSTILTPSGQTNYVTETSWSGPYAYGVAVCAATAGTPTICDTENLNSEWMVVHMPATTVPTMPTLTQLTSTNFRVVQIQDASYPKVVAFGEGNGTYTSAGFTTTHAGTAQYLIAGMTPGAYAVTVGGVAVTGSPFTVNSGDNTIYFESTSGAVSVGVGGASAPTVTTTTATGITGSSASAGGTVTSNGGAGVTAEGTCYATTANPTSPCTSDGAATPFTSLLTGLSAATTYHYRAFATNSAGTGYGSDMTFSTTGALSNIAVSDIGQHYCRVVGNISPDAYVQVFYGTTMGGPYPYNTYPYLTSGGTWALDMGALQGGLQPATQFYFVVQARPNINNTTGQVQSAESSACLTTTGIPYPIAPAKYSPTYPNTTSGYTTITMTTSGGAFVAASTVTHTGGIFCPSDPSWTVTGGDTIPTILTKIKFGAIVEFPQGATGSVPDTNTFNGGFALPVVAVDPCALGISDPNHRWIIFRTQQASAADFPPFGFRTGPAWATKLANLQAQVPTSVLFTSGQIFQAALPGTSATPIHHFWLSNLEFSVNSASSAGPWGAYFMFGNGEGSPQDAQTPPSYMVLDRIYFSTPSPPAFSVTGVAGTVGAGVMMIGNYIVGFQRSGNLGQGIYIEDCSAGPLSILNNEIDAAGQGIYFESVGEPSCGSNPPVMLRNAVVEKNTVYEPPSWLNPLNAGYGAWDGVARGNFRNPFESKNCQICRFAGNWIDGSFSGQNSGQAILITPIGSSTKVTGASGAHDLEVSWNYVRHAAVFADVWGTSVIDGCCGHAPDAALNSNVQMDNNLAVDLGRYLYTINGSTGGLFSDYFISYGVQNHLVYNNSLAFLNGDAGTSGFYFIPMMLGISDGGISSNGFQFTGNLLYFSRGVTGSGSTGIVAQVPTCTDGCATFPVVPFPTTTTYTTSLHTTMVNIAASVTSSSVWGGNVVIGGNSATGAEPWPDLTQAQLNVESANMPSGDLYPPGNTMAARQTAAGLLNVSRDDLTITPNANNFGGAVGANIAGVLSNLGIVKNIVVQAGPSSLQFSYTASDQNICSVDTSPNGTTWTRSTASGASRNQTILVTGLSASTAYQYRLMCYYSQSRPWFSFPSESSNMITEGSAATVASGTRTVAVGLSFPSGAASVTVTLTPLVGSAVMATCSTSPCSVAGVANGANLETIQYWSGAGATGKVLFSGSTWVR